MIYNVLIHDSDRKEKIELPDDIRAGDDIIISVDGIESQYHVMTVGGPVSHGFTHPENIKVVKR